MNNNQIAGEWFQYAQRDLESAKYLQNMRPVPIEIICYHCQQSAEKNLKGYIALNGGQIQRIHDLVALNKVCLGYSPEFFVIEEDCIQLTDYGVQARYPFNLGLNESDMLLAIKNAERIQAFVQSKVSGLL
ncbi:MAG: HEPN domain-containing protein [Firmicutes bacterium]|nr:HEPN domain-containing protein [Bacillota bacterium]